jgi:hypothetical protein
MPKLQDAFMPGNPDFASVETKPHLWIQEGHTESILSDPWNVSTNGYANLQE